jgi:regulator of protease activity HflC (stomatin/prohibitin superfamily)
MTPVFALYLVVFGVIFFLYIVLTSVRVLNEWERGILLRWGRFDHVKLPGLRLVWPVIDRMIKMDLRVITMDVPKQDMMTRDNVPVSVDAVIYFQVVNPQDAYIKVENFVKATSLRAQTTLRSVIGQSELDELLSQREKLNLELQTIIDEQTEPWGVKVTAVEIRDVQLPDGMKRAMANQAETERERRAKVINALGEFQAAEKLREAAAIISEQPQALQLRFLQTLKEISGEHNSTIVFPFPIDLMAAFTKRLSEPQEKTSK